MAVTVLGSLSLPVSISDSEVERVISESRNVDLITQACTTIYKREVFGVPQDAFLKGDKWYHTIGGGHYEMDSLIRKASSKEVAFITALDNLKNN